MIKLPQFRILIIAILVVFAPMANGKDFTDALPRTSFVEEGFRAGEIERELSESALHRIEGIWEFRAQGLRVAIQRGEDSRTQYPGYRMIVLYSLNRAIRPGTVFGYVVAGAKSGEYQARMYTKQIGSKLILPKRFTLRLEDDDSSLTMEQRRSKFSVNLWRLLPFVWRYAVHPNYQAADVKGCVRVFPAPLRPTEPVYL